MKIIKNVVKHEKKMIYTINYSPSKKLKNKKDVAGFVRSGMDEMVKDSENNCTGVLKLLKGTKKTERNFDFEFKFDPKTKNKKILKIMNDIFAAENKKSEKFIKKENIE